jgi:hypothetical protein
MGGRSNVVKPWAGRQKKMERASIAAARKTRPHGTVQAEANRRLYWLPSRSGREPRADRTPICDLPFWRSLRSLVLELV